MTERDLLLREILDNPADDTARLVYADRLDELGGARNAPRAEFIRVQVELPRVVVRPVLPCHITAYGAGGATMEVEAIVDLGDVRPGSVFDLHHRQRDDSTFTYHGAHLLSLSKFDDSRWLGKFLVIGGQCPNRARHRELKAREAALLKTWCGAWLPKSLRPGYPGLRVEGNVVWCDPMGGYVRFERGFVAHAGCELPWRVDGAVARARTFGNQVRSLFGANPLTGFTASFEGAAETLTAEINRLDLLESNRRPWRVMWDVNTYSQLPHSATASPCTMDDRVGLERQLMSWFAQAICGPAAIVQRVRELQAAMADYADPGPDLSGDDGDQGYGHSHW